MRRTILLLNLCRWMLVPLIIFLSPLSGHTQSVTKSGMSKERLARIPVRMKALVEQGLMAGAVTLIARRGEIVSFEAIGYQDLENRRPMRTDTIFDIRSITKPVTAIGIMVLMEEGKLGLDDPVEKYLPDFRSKRQAQGEPNPITIRHLLTHTAGMPFNRPPQIEDITITRDRALSEVVTILSRQEPEFEPGTQFRYYSGGFAILGRIIEVASGKPYEQFIRERIFAPLGMKDSFFFIPEDRRSRVAPVYRFQNGKLGRWEEIENYSKRAKYPGPEFGMYSTASDLAALCQMMLDGGSFKGKRILSRMSVQAMTENNTLNIKSAVTQRSVYQGLGWGLSGDPASDFPLTSAGSFGHNGAFGSIIWIDPKEGLVRIFLEHQFGAGSEGNIFMAMAGAAVAD
jgi:CubicO group peptidase (beta-lactamase class C family)